MLAYARKVLESQLDTVQSLLAEGAATSRILSIDPEQPRAADALLVQLAQANAQHWSECSRRVAEATVQVQAQCMQLLGTHAVRDGAQAFTTLPHPPANDNVVAQLLQPLQVMLDLLSSATRPWLGVPGQDRVRGAS
jgi:hypothetical protein